LVRRSARRLGRETVMSLDRFPVLGAYIRFPRYCLRILGKLLLDGGSGDLAGRNVRKDPQAPTRIRLPCRSPSPHPSLWARSAGLVEVSGDPSHDSAVLCLFAQLYALMHTVHPDDVTYAEKKHVSRRVELETVTQKCLRSLGHLTRFDCLGLRGVTWHVCQDGGPRWLEFGALCRIDWFSTLNASVTTQLQHEHLLRREGTEEEMWLIIGWVFVGSLSLLCEETQGCQVLVEEGGTAVSLDSFHEILGVPTNSFSLCSASRHAG